jgi:hypothetical protein
MSSANNCGFFLRAVEDVNPPLPGGRYLEVFRTDERGEADGDPVVSCFVADFETDEEAVTGLLTEFLHPFGAAWESPEQYGRELEAVKWLAEFHGINPEDYK